MSCGWDSGGCERCERYEADTGGGALRLAKQSHPARKKETNYIMAPSLTKDVKVLKRKAVDTAPDAVVVKTKKTKKAVAAASPEKVVADAAATPTKKLSSAKKAAAELFASPAAPAKAAGGEDVLTADAYRAKHDITVKGVPSPAVYQTFAEAPFPAPLKAALAAAGFAAPSPIQVR